MKKLFLTILILAVSTSATGQQAFSSLEEQMSGNEFNATGLEKLTPVELAALNQWIRSRSLATLDAASPTAAATPEERGTDVSSIQNMERSLITSHLVGKFTGWDGQTVFKLENGMIWEQTDKDKFYTKEVENPVVSIEPGAFKSWKLSVEGYDSHCKVKRIQ